MADKATKADRDDTNTIQEVREISWDWIIGPKGYRGKGSTYEIAALKALSRASVAEQVGRVADALERIADNLED